MKNNKSIDDRIMKKIFDIKDGSYSINSSIGKLLIEKSTAEEKTKNDYYKKSSVNILNENGVLTTSYFLDMHDYFGDDHYGYYSTYHNTWVIDYPEDEYFNEYDIKNYMRMNNETVVLNCNSDNKKCYYITPSSIKLNEGKFIKKSYNVFDNYIQQKGGCIGINVTNGNINILVNDRWLEFSEDEDVAKKIELYTNKLNDLQQYINQNASDVKELIRGTFSIRIGEKDNFIEMGEVNEIIKELKKVKKIYSDAMIILNYKHDVKLKKEIAMGLNNYYSECKSCSPASNEMSKKNEDIFNKVKELKTGFYTFLTADGVIDIDVDSTIDIILNDEIIFRNFSETCYDIDKISEESYEQLVAFIDAQIEIQKNESTQAKIKATKEKVKALELELKKLESEL